jgi:hypothetical protein
MTEFLSHPVIPECLYRESIYLQIDINLQTHKRRH